MDFYAGILGLRLVKQTVNFDDPETYHFYFGDEQGKPGTIITFFPWAGARQGQIGDGQVGVTMYAVPKGALPFWEKRLGEFNVLYKKLNRFDQTVLQFDDPHGLHLELVETTTGELNTWAFDGITKEVAIKGFAGAVLFSAYPEKTAELLEQTFGFRKITEDVDYIRYQSEAGIGNTIDIKKTSSGPSRMGVGTVHHIALRTDDLNSQQDWQRTIRSKGFGVTEIRDRNYFTSIYFREWGHILFEIATDEPGFAIDEPLEELGKALKLPEQYEPYRERIEKGLLPFEVRTVKKETL